MPNKSIAKDSICRLCGSVTFLVKSHIIPYAFFNIEPDQPSKLVSNQAGSYPKRAPIGVYDRIICKSCEESFNLYDNYAANVLLQNLDKHKAVIYKNDTLAYIISSVDYRLLKLFVISLVWRASVAAHSFYSKVQLGPFEEEARVLLRNDETGTPHQFAAWWSVFKMDGAPGLMDPFRERWMGVNAYRFYLGKVVCYIKVDKQNIPNVFQDCALYPGRDLVLITRNFEKSSDFRAMLTVFKSTMQ